MLDSVLKGIGVWGALIFCCLLGIVLAFVSHKTGVEFFQDMAEAYKEAYELDL